MNRFANLTPLCVAAAAGAACLFIAGAAQACSPDWSRVDDPQLEALFWDCDARATQEVLPAGDGALCAMAHDELKRRRFDGDLERLLAWWHSHKADEHARRAGVETAVAEPGELALQAP
jgi:hypothetical protein